MEKNNKVPTFPLVNQMINTINNSEISPNATAYNSSPKILKKTNSIKKYEKSLMNSQNNVNQSSIQNTLLPLCFVNQKNDNNPVLNDCTDNFLRKESVSGTSNFKNEW
jgi:hypothetical protein